MKRLLCIAAVAAVALCGLPAQAQTVAEGAWINLFDGESLFGWTAYGDVEWEAADGVLSGARGYEGFLATNCRFTDFELEMKLTVAGEGSAGIAVRAGIEDHVSVNGGDCIVIEAEPRDAQEHTVTVKAVGSDVKAALDGKAVELAPKNAKGHIAIQYHRYHKMRRWPKIAVTEVKLRPLNLTPVFNGENLDGWNIIPDRKSVFSVVDGAINIKDGNGQIETAGVYKDFVLQLDIISNGDCLNSGVFFRTPPGVFWKGYESQVRNEWVKDDRAKPVDFGTGGLYGIQPARKVVSTDHEWFQKTVICDSNHFAVWIDGYQVSDYFDTRPAVTDADGKNGFVPDAGTVNLQGHDPTTDLSFKNINVQIYP